MIRDRVLRWIGRTAHRYWYLVLAVAAVSVVLCIIAVLGLQITTGYVDLLPQEHPAVKNYFKVLEKFGGTDYFLAVVEAPDRERVHEAVDDLTARLEDTGEFEYIQSKTDLSGFTRYGLLFFDIETLKKIDLLLSERKFDELTELARSFVSLREQMSRTAGAGLNVDEQGYFTNAEGDVGLVIGRPSFSSDDTEKIGPFGRLSSDVARRVMQDHPETRVLLAGSYQFQYEQRAILKRDMVLVGLVSLLLIIIILTVAFRSIGMPLMAMLSLGCALLWTLGLAWATVRSLNTVSAVFVVVLLGIGIEYGIALYSRYSEQRVRGMSGEEAFISAMANTGQGIITGALTTAGAFFAIAFSDFKAMHDMGIVLGLGVLCALVSMLFVFPAIITLKERFRPFRAAGTGREERLMRRLGGGVSRRAAAFVAVWLVLTVGLGVSASFIKYETNIRNVQPAGMDVTRAEDEVAREFGMVSDYLIVLSSNEAAMREDTSKLQKLGTVRAVESLATVIPSDQIAKLVVMSRIKTKIERINPDWLGYVPPEMLTILENIGADTLTLDKLPPEVRDKYISEDGVYATYVYPKKSMDDEKDVCAFLDQVETVSTDVAGYPVLIKDTLDSTRGGLSETTLLSAVAVMLLVIMDFQALVPTLLALLPLLLSMVLMVGVISLVGMKFNIVNIAATPIILGIGVDFGVYILHRYKEEHPARGDTIPAVLSHTGRAIVVSGLTVIAAFSALVLARFQGLADLGIAASVGIGFAVLSSVTLLTAILRLLERRRKRGRAF